MSLWGREERLRIDREKTEKLLNERALMMEMKAKEFDQRVEIQNALQREADLTFRFRSLCNRIRPLRDEEQQKKKKSHILQEGNAKNMDEMVEGSGRKTPCLKIDELKWNDY